MLPSVELTARGLRLRFLAVARTIVIGDLHGCAVELSDLLDRLALAIDDRVYFVGDLVARGPDSHGVLACVRRIGGQAVRGNHEDRLLAARHSRQQGQPGPRLGGSHTRLLNALTEEEWEFLASLPYKLDIEANGLRVVHAGVMPGLAWEQQDPWVVTHIRSIDDAGEPSHRWGTPWGLSYNGPLHVVFGHNAQRDVQLHPHATGIDTGCVYGGALTALVLPEGAAPPTLESRRDALVSVPARQQYSDYGRSLP